MAMAMAKEEAKGKVTVFFNASILTMDKGYRVFLNNGAMAVVGDKIAAVGKTEEVLSAYEGKADEVLDLTSRWIMPGMINTHVHTSQQLARGIADDVDLLTWLHDRVWPYESNMTDEDSYLSTLLCGIELIHSGVTCFAEAGGQHVPAMARAVEELGIRACLTRSTMDCGEGLPPSWAAETTESCLQVQEELFDKLNGSAEGRIRIWFGLRQILNSTDPLLLGTKAAADKHKTGIHMHVAEIPFENEWVTKTRKVDHGTVTHLENIGVLGENLLAAHCVWVSPNEVQMLSKRGVKVSHCPAAAMRMLGSAPIVAMHEAGVCVSIGTDGAPSNNRMSLVDEMFLASLINKGRVPYENGTDPEFLPLETMLTMVTTSGAKTVLWENEIGSLEVGKKADLVIIDPNLWTMLPLLDPIANMVNCMRTENIESVMCNGRWIMKNRKILTVDEVEICQKAQKGASKLMERANIILPPRFNLVL